jgi:3-oxoacyl-[acyl-carrier-protein] synthase III
MRWNKVQIDAISYELGPVVISSAELEDRLRPAYERWRIPMGQIESLTGISERRWWAPGTPLSRGAVAAGTRLLNDLPYGSESIGALVYGGVCRENFEPATACRIAHELGIRGNVWVHDLSNACLGALNGMIDVANRIELGQISAGLVVSCESSREIMENAIARVLEARDIESFRYGLATMTGGSGAIAIALSNGAHGQRGHKLVGAATRAWPEHHGLCLWGLEAQEQPFNARPFMRTDSVAVLKNGVALGQETWRAFLKELQWSPSEVDRAIGHQVGSGHREAILAALELSKEQDFNTFEYLGNIGTVSLPITLQIANERGLIEDGDKVALLGIGSGLNCTMLGLEW